MAWAKNGTPDTLTSAGDTMTISDLTASEFNVLLIHKIGAGTNANMLLRGNNDSGNNYAQRYSTDGAADGTNGSNSTGFLQFNYNNNVDTFGIAYVCSISGEEKLGMSWGTDQNSAGAGNAPSRREDVGKYVPSPDADITRFDVHNTNAGDYASGSNLTALNGDTTESFVLGNIQSGSRMEVTDTKKIYYWNGSTFTEEA